MSPLVRPGEYARQLQPFLEAFPNRQIQVLILARVIADTPGESAPFLGHLAPGRPHALPRKAANVSYRHTRLPEMLRKVGKRLLDKGMAGTAKTFRRLGNRIGRPNTPIPTRPSGQTLAQLRADYAPLNRDLESLLGMRIPEWDYH